MESDATGKGRKPAGKPYERPRGGQARAIADLMPEIGRTAFRKFGFVQSSVVTRWSEIVGERHARVCRPESIRFPIGEKSDGILQLLVVPAHAPIIQHVIPEIIERVNRFFGYNAVAKVKLRQGAVQPPADKSERRAAVAEADPARTRRIAARYRRPGAANRAGIAGTKLGHPGGRQRRMTR